MARSVEYENLIKIGNFKEVPGNPAFIDQYLVGAYGLLSDAANNMRPASRYLLSYDAFFQVVQAVLESNDVRTTDKQGHRTLAIQRVGADLKLSPGELKVVTDAHNRRNDVTYRAPIPPISQVEADALLKIANAFLERACKALGKNFPPP